MQCYCSICRKTAGGSGSAINIMGQAKTLKVSGKKNIKIYHAIMGKNKNGKLKRSTGRRHFCKHCGSCLWIYDPQWPEWCYPFASAIDTKLPKPPEHYHVGLKYAANWCEIPNGKQHKHSPTWPELSIENWHRQHGLLSVIKNSKNIQHKHSK